jgi:4-hydroxy-3-methylbut-2-enyl diphosphate reductase
VRARFTGPCFGVRDALATVDAVLGEDDRRPVVALGSIVHNPQAQQRLAGRGLSVERDPARVAEGSRLVITAHGAPPSVFEAASRRGLEVVDTTCPLVRRVQEAAVAVRDAGRSLVVVGHGEHPEVRGVLGWAGCGHLVSSPAEVEAVPAGRHLGVVVQSTFPGAHLPPILAALEERALSVEVHDTRCPVVTMRHRDGGQLVDQADVIVVVGGRSSANTRALAETCAARRPTYHVETPDEVRREWFSPGQRIGIASGTSTPDGLVDAVDELCRSF